VLLLPWPPTTNTVPLVNKKAEVDERGVFRLPVTLHVPATGV
jgi:hypothetical protein